MQIRGRLGVRPKLELAIERQRIKARLRHVLADQDGARRIEIGPGPYPTPGYVHVDIDPRSPHLEAVGPMWDLPFPDAWASEIRGIHTLEHVHPSRLLNTLSEWRRVLGPGGSVVVSVPHGPSIMRAFACAPVDEKWPLIGSILGMYCGPEVRSPAELRTPSDHQMVFDLPLLTWAFTTSGFEDVQDISREHEDRHAAAWHHVPGYSLTVRAS